MSTTTTSSPFAFRVFSVTDPLQVTIPDRFITFCHPALPEGTILLRLYAVDKVPADVVPDTGEIAVSEKYGIHHGTALDACQIIANNRAGFLASSRRPEDRVPSEAECVLTADKYYYFLGDAIATENYPVVTTFADWTFPEEIPARWRIFDRPVSVLASSIAPGGMSDAVKVRDKICRVSKYGDQVQNTHIIPKEELSWFNKNKMYIHNINDRLPANEKTQDLRNGVLLRADIHESFDARQFVFLPKLNHPVVHFLRPTGVLGALYHNAVLDHPEDSRAAFWYARFARNIFPLVDFLPDIPENARILTQREGMVEERLGPAAPSSSTSKRGRGSTRSSDLPPPASKRGKRGDRSQTTPEQEALPLDEEAEYLEDLELQRTRFPTMSEEHEYSDDSVWNEVYWYPGHRQVQRQMEHYKRDHPSVVAVGEPEKAIWVEGNDL